jgi:hypothetical protein
MKKLVVQAFVSRRHCFDYTSCTSRKDLGSLEALVVAPAVLRAAIVGVVSV